MSFDPVAFSPSAGGTSVLVPGADEARKEGRDPGKARSGGGAPPDRGDGGGGDDDSWRGPSDDEPQPYRPTVPTDAASFALSLTLIGITSLFIVFIAAFVMRRLNAPSWPPAGAPGPPASLWISTAVLTASSISMALASGAARRGVRRLVLRFLTGTLLAGVGFVVAQLAMWVSLSSAGLLPSTNGYGAVFYSLTGLHAAVAARASFLGGGGHLLDLALRDVAAYAAFVGAPTDAADAARETVPPIAAPPRARHPSGPARSLGADTAAVLSEFNIPC